jgi:hypothetical protein
MRHYMVDEYCECLLSSWKVGLVAYDVMYALDFSAVLRSGWVSQGLLVAYDVMYALDFQCKIFISLPPTVYAFPPLNANVTSWGS